ncbi:DUF6632 domain-containing protein [Xanthovirga aplysinae]|uniref:DUF6632 domain-containing protein n=1 Tax=Xanthovirga aplysinae TaxID=2529853 RepID=UPI0012BD7F6A|nr:DUF6632 domain-containing protein [Xanthovirga aplysinae]MTI32800.1 hypothetical protein [Xanthovirga aplysinae]
MKTKDITLRWTLRVIGLLFLLGIPTFMYFWPEAWSWEPRQTEYENMIIGIYAVLGIFILLASRNPLENISLIWFVIWSSLVHATIMAIQAFFDPIETPNLYGDIPALFLVAIILLLQMPISKERYSIRE